MSTVLERIKKVWTECQELGIEDLPGSSGVGRKWWVRRSGTKVLLQRVYNREKLSTPDDGGAEFTPNS